MEDTSDYLKNLIIQDDSQDTLLHASAIIACLQHVSVKEGIEDEGELGFSLILEMVRNALRFEALERNA